ncbi:hypothetical protein F53441_354 [Fusarium austroafricanum]|uniref:Uncharacterized protein n=1 Tax=Fusarium austroafricanum TaxID=2364996 RepID=A0A8H4KX05_9HYPO|nr:hypothetical protein F53441_354 [Fusarium austroafricanum]
MASHKLTPALMTGSLFLGLGLAIGHHFYYDFLNGRVVESQDQQEWFLRVGTGMAFLARALLSAAVGFAYTQILWRTLRSKSVTVEGINSLFGILTNAWDFTTWELWTAAPALAVVAMIAWALPLIAVVTPATLTVQVSSHPNVTIVDAPLPLIDYDNKLNFAQWASGGGKGYYAPSSYVSRILLSVASSGSILNIPAPFPNSSYTLDFYGPTISCGTPRNASLALFLSETVGNTSLFGGTGTGYAGFIPVDLGENATESDLALWGLQQTMNGTDPDMFYDQTSVKTNEPAKLYVVVPKDGTFRTGAMEPIECQLYNSSFAVNFTFNNGRQNISYKSKRLNGVNYLDMPNINERDAPSAPVAYISFMDSLGRLLLGKLVTSHYGALAPHGTQIMSSVLMDTKEMMKLRAVNNPSYLDKDHQVDGPSVIGNISMVDALEQLFTNATISLFSSSQFLQNQTAASRGPITRRSPQIAFSYEPRNLFIAYGTGIVFTAFIVTGGLLCIKSASASYANSFSTILRTTRNRDLDTVIPAAETTGAEPLSKHLGNVRLVLRRQGHSLGINDEGRAFFALDSMSDEMKRTHVDYSNKSLIPHERELQPSDPSLEHLRY